MAVARQQAAAVKDLSQSTSFHSRERIAPSNAGIKHLERGGWFCEAETRRTRLDSPAIHGSSLQCLPAEIPRWSINAAHVLGQGNACPGVPRAYRSLGTTISFSRVRRFPRRAPNFWRCHLRRYRREGMERFPA